MEVPSLFIALVAGLVSFLSPCVLPLVPAYIGYLSGSALQAARGVPATATATATATSTATATFGVRGGGAARESGTADHASVNSATARWVVMGHALLFVIGLTVVFVVVIGGMAGALSFLLREKKLILQQIMGVLLIVFGLHTVGLLRIPFLDYTRRMEVRSAANLGGVGAPVYMAYLRSFLIGAAFGIGWTPCVGPTLGAIFTLALNGREAEVFLPALAYSLGLGIPFLLTALALGRVSAGIKRITRRSYSLRLGNWTLIEGVNVISIVSGLMLVTMGVLVFTNSLTWLTILAPNFGV